MHMLSVPFFNIAVSQTLCDTVFSECLVLKIGGGGTGSDTLQEDWVDEDKCIQASLRFISTRLSSSLYTDTNLLSLPRQLNTIAAHARYF